MGEQPDRFMVVPAAYVFFLREGPPGVREVLLQLRRNTGYRDGHWAAAAAGHVERGETPYDAARREAAEELGLTDVELTAVTAMARTGATGDPVDERVDYFFTSTRWVGEPTIMEPAKCADLGWFPLESPPDPVVPHERVVLEGLAGAGLPPIVHVGFG